MPITRFNAWMDESVTEVLESMCFLAAEEYPGAVAAKSDFMISSRLEFHGPERGSFGIRTSLSTARLIACNMLGEEPEDVGETEAGEVVGELANMVCGAVLARFVTSQAFDLTHPRSEMTSMEGGESEARIQRGFVVEDGPLVAWMEIEESK